MPYKILLYSYIAKSVIEPAHEFMVLTTSATAQASLGIRTVSPEPSLFAHMKYEVKYGSEVWK